MSPAGGRRRLTRGVFSIEDQQLTLPDPIALDTSFVVEALLATQPLHGACDAFLKRIFDNGVSVVTSELLRIERAETAFAIAMKERWGGRWRAHRTDGLLPDGSRTPARPEHRSYDLRCPGTVAAYAVIGPVTGVIIWVALSRSAGFATLLQ